MGNLKKIAIIPARGGSKRLPRKNILQVNGKPMLSHTIGTALGSNLFDDVVVSTEDNEIAGVAKAAGATVVKRPIELAQDNSTVVQVCSHVISLPEYAHVEVFCCLYATAILVHIGDLIKSIELLDTGPEANFIMCVSHYNYHPVQALKRNGEYLQMMWPEYKGIQSQSYPEVVVSNGTFYWARREAFLNNQSFYGDRLKGYLIPCERAVDVDSMDDLIELKNLVSIAENRKDRS